MKFAYAITSLAWIITTLALSSFLDVPVIERFQVDTKASTLTWVGKKVTGEHTGTVQITSGTLATDGKNISKGEFEIDLTSLTVTDLTDKNSNDKLVTHLKSDDFFGVAKHPKANLTVTSISKKTGDEYVVNGKLTIKGITNDIQFPALIVRNGKKLTATAKIVVDRTKYDIKFKSASFFENLGDKAIYNDFELNLKLVASLQTGA
jgi:polyisoprenoid-binding protein YceI